MIPLVSCVVQVLDPDIKKLLKGHDTWTVTDFGDNIVAYKVALYWGENNPSVAMPTILAGIGRGVDKLFQVELVLTP